MSSGEEKTEQPSDYKLKEARKKGNVAKSADTAALTALALAMMAIFFFLPI